MSALLFALVDAVLRIELRHSRYARGMTRHLTVRSAARRTHWSVSESIADLGWWRSLWGVL